MLNIDTYDSNGYGISIKISDHDGLKYTYEYVTDLEHYPCINETAEFYTSNPISPLELPAIILTLVTEKYFDNVKGR